MDTITLHKHVTDGGAVYWQDNFRIADCKVLIRTDGGEIEVIKFAPEECQHINFEDNLTGSKCLDCGEEL